MLPVAVIAPVSSTLPLTEIVLPPVPVTVMLPLTDRLPWMLVLPTICTPELFSVMLTVVPILITTFVFVRTMLTAFALMSL